MSWGWSALTGAVNLVSGAASLVSGAASMVMANPRKDHRALHLRKIEICALFALYPFMPEETRYAIRSDGIVVIHIPYMDGGPSGEIVYKAQSVVRKFTGNSKEEVTDFVAAIRDVYNHSGGHEVCSQILQYTAQGLESYAQLYEKKEGPYAEHLRLLKEVIEKKSDKNQLPSIDKERLEELATYVRKVWDRHSKKQSNLADLNAAIAFIGTLQKERRGSLIQSEQQQ